MKLSLLFFRWFAGMPFRALGLKRHFYLRNHYKREMQDTQPEAGRDLNVYYKTNNIQFIHATANNEMVGGAVGFIERTGR